MIVFNPSIAERVGVNAAVLFEHITRDLDHAFKSREGVIHGRPWCQLYPDYIGAQYSYIDPIAARIAIERLVAHDMIICTQYENEAGETVFSITNPVHQGGRSNG